MGISELCSVFLIHPLDDVTIQEFDELGIQINDRFIDASIQELRGIKYWTVNISNPITLLNINERLNGLPVTAARGDETFYAL